jgi:hypothetical protein
MAVIICDNDDRLNDCINILPHGIELKMLHIKELWYLYFRES